MKRLWNRHRQHALQLTLYLVTGVASAAVDYAAYLAFFWLGMWYILASIISFVFSFATAFLLHKYLVFKRSKTFWKHLSRHLSVEGVNLVATTLLLYAMVENGLMSEELAKLVSMGCVAFWNFFIFKFIVYV